MPTSSSSSSFSQVVTATRHVHTEAYVAPATPPPKPYAMLGCSRRQHKHEQQQQQQQHGGRRRRSSREQAGLIFRFRLRWGSGARGAGRPEGRGFAQGGGGQAQVLLAAFVPWVCV